MQHANPNLYAGRREEALVLRPAMKSEILRDPLTSPQIRLSRGETGQSGC